MDPKKETEMQRITEKEKAQRAQCIPTAKGRQRHRDRETERERQRERKTEKEMETERKQDPIDTDPQTAIRKPGERQAN